MEGLLYVSPKLWTLAQIMYFEGQYRGTLRVCNLCSRLKIEKQFLLDCSYLQGTLTNLCRKDFQGFHCLL